MMPRILDLEAISQFEVEVDRIRTLAKMTNVTIEAEPAPVEWTFFYRTLRAYLDVIDRLLRGEAQPVHLTLSRAEAEAVAGMLETFSGCEANPLVRQLGSRLEAIVHELKA